ncbi:MAG: DUF2157 domain-containing protein [Chitinophagaceae bacterium]
MKTSLADKLLETGCITQSEHEIILQKQPISVHWDLRSLLYLGVLLVTTSIGILIYKNIDSIGHDALLIIIAVLMCACFAWCFKNAKGYRPTKINSMSIWSDYILLTGCLLLLTLIAYLQFQYEFFGNRLGLALFIPMILLFIKAYYFDHIGVLSLAITNLAAWAGIAITPTKLLAENNFSEERIMFTGLALGVLLIILAIFSTRKNIKAHFAFTYKNFGINLLFICMLSILFYYEPIYLLNFLIFAVVAWFVYKICVKSSTYLLVISILYFYIGLSYVAVRLLSFESAASLYSILLYFILSGIGLIMVFKNLQKKIKTQ